MWAGMEERVIVMKVWVVGSVGGDGGQGDGRGGVVRGSVMTDAVKAVFQTVSEVNTSENISSQLTSLLYRQATAVMINKISFIIIITM